MKMASIFFIGFLLVVDVFRHANAYNYQINFNPPEQLNSLFQANNRNKDRLCKPDFQKLGRRTSDTKCLEYLWEKNNQVYEASSPYQCTSDEKIIPKPNFPPIFGGYSALPGEFPHMGAVGWELKNHTWVFKCGCSLISPKFTLTAAHCSRSPKDETLISPVPDIVRIGHNKITRYPSERLLFDEKILKVIVHPLYSSPKRYNDIALIELERAQLFTSLVQPACLWGDFSTDRLGTSATITGWGATEKDIKISPELQTAVVDIIDSTLCDFLLRPSCNRLWCGIQEHQICAGNLSGGVDACQGDSGGPLQLKINLPQHNQEPMYYVIGVTSFGIGCARPSLPGVYTRVSSFIDWIESIVWPEN